MKVRIAFVTVPGTTDLDVDRIGAIEEWPPLDARQMIKDGVAAEATAQDIADYEARQAAEATAKAAQDAQPEPVDDTRRAVRPKVQAPAVEA